MVDADAVVLRPSAGLIVPERVGLCAVRGGAKGIDQTQIHQTTISGAAFRLIQRVPQPICGILGVLRLRDHVVISGENERRLLSQPLPCSALQTLHPAKLIGEFLRADRVAVGKVQRGDADRTSARRP